MNNGPNQVRYNVNQPELIPGNQPGGQGNPDQVNEQPVPYWSEQQIIDQ